MTKFEKSNATLMPFYDELSIEVTAGMKKDKFYHSYFGNSGHPLENSIFSETRYNSKINSERNARE